MAGSPRNGYSDVLRTRVDSLTEDVRGFHADLRDVRESMATRLDITGLGEQITKLSTKQDNLGSTNWQMIGVAVTILGLLGAVLYWPINRDTGRLDVAVQAILDRGVFQRQYDADQMRNTTEHVKLRDDFNQTILARRYDADQLRQTTINDSRASKTDLEQALVGVRSEIVANQERLRYIISNYLQTPEFNAQHGDLKTLVAAQVENLQRQMNGVQGRLNETWSARDALIDMRERLNHVEQGKNK